MARPTKICRKCKLEKDILLFSKDITKRDGIHIECKACDLIYYKANKQKIIEQKKIYRKENSTKRSDYMRVYRIENADKVKSSNLKVFGISLEDYRKMEMKQSSVCAICNNKCKTGKDLCVDHDHKTGKIRGLLCQKCNSAIGLLNDDVKIIEKALTYLYGN